MKRFYLNDNKSVSKIRSVNPIKRSSESPSSFSDDLFDFQLAQLPFTRPCACDA
ncbi:hypothetical protein MCC93_04590 [Morococcus cerebrosus]|uniref:Uncharacterized protein n=1 Tax=Morococcus cerebrosus TaxID=1056807 RepID=A0A0C1H280_9NEIS|nr:hypothetical protein MCC93_04590 [Morococcus cerebrosus]